MSAAPRIEEMDGAPGTAVAKAQAGNLSRTAGQSANSVTELLQLAIQQGTPVEQLEKLVDLHERMQERQARQELANAIAAFQAECPPIKHSKAVDFTARNGQKVQYSYAELDEIARKVGPILARHGLSYRWDTSVEKDMLTCVCTVSHVAGHSVSSSFTLPTENSSAASPQQKIGMAATFAQRRSLSSALGLTTTDNDTDAAEVDPTPITEDQVTELDDLLREVGANRVKFLKYMEAKSLAEIRAVDYKTALAAIDDYRAAKARKESAS